MLLERYDDALFAFQKVLVREPDNALARVNVGYICLKKGIFGEAIEHLTRA
jgi:tetratricopeptide (TPR) repeat protein